MVLATEMIEGRWGRRENFVLMSPEEAVDAIVHCEDIEFVRTESDITKTMYF